MSVRALFAFALCAALFVGAAQAQTPLGKPYARVVASFDRAAESDADLVAFVGTLKAAVDAQDVAAVAAILSDKFLALDCAANPLKACAPGKARQVGRKSGRPLDRMRLAFCCEGKPSSDMPEASQNETMFAILAATLANGTLGANPDARGQVCAPALPRIDRAKAAAAAKAAGVEPENLRVATLEIPLRDSPRTDAPVSTGLAAGDLAPVVTDLTAAVPAGWNAIGLPDGSIGYTDALGLDELTPAAICFGRTRGQWRIVATIQRGG